MVVWLSEGGASSDPCSNTYAGPSPWSEVEVTNIADFYCTISRHVVIYLAFHSAGHYLLFPFGTSTEKIKDYDNLMQVGVAARDALRKRHDIVYRVGNSNEVLCKAWNLTVELFEP
jgi:Zinc carboxypeptidase